MNFDPQKYVNLRAFIGCRTFCRHHSRLFLTDGGYLGANSKNIKQLILNKKKNPEKVLFGKIFQTTNFPRKKEKHPLYFGFLCEMLRLSGYFLGGFLVICFGLLCLLAFSKMVNCVSPKLLTVCQRVRRTRSKGSKALQLEGGPGGAQDF